MPSCDCYFHLLINFVKHSWVVVFLRVVMEADHAILLVNASIYLTIFDLQEKKKKECDRERKKIRASQEQSIKDALTTQLEHCVLRSSSLEIKKNIYCVFLNWLTMCNTYFSASCGPDSCTRLAMSCKDSVRKVCRKQKTDLSKRCVATVSLSTWTIEVICLIINSQKTMNSHRPLLTSGCSSCTGRRGTVWPGLCCCLVWTSHCVYSPSCVALPGCWWCKPEPTRGTHCSVAVGSKTTADKNRKQVSHCKAFYEIMTFIHGVISFLTLMNLPTIWEVYLGSGCTFPWRMSDTRMYFL